MPVPHHYAGDLADHKLLPQYEKQHSHAGKSPHPCTSHGRNRPNCTVRLHFYAGADLRNRADGEEVQGKQNSGGGKNAHPGSNQDESAVSYIKFNIDSPQLISGLPFNIAIYQYINSH